MSQTQGAPGTRISGGAALGKRPPGRPKGYPKTGGSKKDVPPATSAEMRQRIIKQADPVGFLIAVAAGRVVETYDPTAKRKKKHAPTFEQRLEAAGKLVRKILPDLGQMQVDATLDAQHVHAHLVADLAGLSPVEREQRLLAVRDELSRIGERWPETLTDQERATLARALPEASPAGDDALAQGEAAQPPRPPSYARPAPGYAVRLVEPDSIAALEAAAAGAAAQADGADPDDEGSIEVARLRAETLSAGALHERVPPRHPERPVSWADRMAARRRDAD